MRDLDQQGRERARNDLHERLGKYDLLKVRVFPPRHLIPPYSQVFIRNWVLQRGPRRVYVNFKIFQLV